LENWINNVVFDYKGITLTHLSVLRTILIAVLTWAAVALSKRFWMRVERNHENFNRSNLFLVSRLTTTLIVVIGIIVALEYLGMDFGKLTLVASALSVGIGFGLQDSVKNMVAGIIILTERTIRVGDWIVCGTTTGFVQKITIRSTIILTWDKAEIVVPNSDLVSHQITNLTLTESTGRIVLRVGVAYGTDIKLVENILLSAAQYHPGILTDGSEPVPVVLFTGFGESALEFELRSFVKDVVSRLFVISDLYKNIYQEFNHHAIKIPFPQREIHMDAKSDQQNFEPSESSA
jgi:small-conductance mechanosensitive channel